MKHLTKVTIVMLVMLTTAFSVAAQTSATGTASAVLITPITIVKNVDMNFGSIAVSASVAGTAILSPAGTRTTGGGGGVTLPATAGTVSAASFAVSGQGSYTYAITLPTSATITDASSHTMVVNAFTSSPATSGLLSSGGTQTLNVGATLNVAAGQVAGVYTNATGVPVTVNYN